MRDGVVDHQPVDELVEGSLHPRRRRLALEDDLAPLVGDAQRQLERARVLSGDEDRRSERARAGIDLRLGQVERVRALDVSRGHVVSDRVPRDATVLAEHDADLRLGHVPGRVLADADRRTRPDRASHHRVLHEELRSRRVVDHRVDVLHRALLDAGVARALVGHARAPDLGCVERRDELVRRRELERVGIERIDPRAARP